MFHSSTDEGAIRTTCGYSTAVDMALVVLLRGVNVGGHRTFSPSALVRNLKLDAVNIGAAGTFVVRKSIPREKLRIVLARQLPFDADVIICDGSEIRRLVLAEPFSGQPAGPTIMHFVSVMATRKASVPPVPLAIPPAGDWGLKILDVQGRFIVGMCRREMKGIGYLGQIEKIFGVRLTTRSWSTILRIARTLEEGS